jgi:hypothetical protein
MKPSIETTLPILGTAIFLSPAAIALSCERPPEALIARDAEIAFVGKVPSVEESSFNPRPGLCWEKSAKNPECGGHLVLLEVTRPPRKQDVGRVRALSEDSCYCVGARWNVGDKYLVVAKQNDSTIRADLIARGLCSGTSRMTESDASSLADKLAKPQ